MHSIADLLAQRASSRPDSVFVVDGDLRLTYAQLRERSTGQAGALADAGVSRGDRVAILLPRGIDALVAFFGAQMLGAVTIFMSDVLKPAQIAHILDHSGARALITGGRPRPPDLGSAPGLTVLPSGGRGTPPKRGVHTSRDLAALFYTSGSTGMPKGVMFTQENLLSGAEIVASYLELGAADRVLSVLPWSFDYGFNQVLSTMWAGGRLVVARSTHAPDLCRVLAEARITGLAGVPPFWEILVGRTSPFLGTRLPDLRYITNSGGVMRPGTLQAIRRAHPSAQVFLMYGLTEAFRSTYLPPDLVDQHPTSMGREIPDTEILVLNEDGRPCLPGEVGELVHRGPTVAAGYWNDPEATVRVFRPSPVAPPGAVGEMAVYSGDYVRRDPDGLLYYVGRRDELFKRRGMRVNPTEIESFLLGTGLVTHAVVFAEPGEESDPDVVAVVVHTGDRIDTAALAQACRSGLPAFQRPSRFVLRQEMPRTASGKVDRVMVKESAREHAG
jgi:amino acid adenylation domain-containing protein